MKRTSLVTAIALLAAATTNAATARERQSLGWSSIFTNDILGDQSDRWRSSAYTLSHIRGPEWTGELPDGIGDLIEYRFSADMISPANLTAPAAGDRPYAGVLGAGAFAHFDHHGYDVRLGVSLYATGPQTGLGDLQGDFHDWIGADVPSPAVLAAQIPNDFYLTGNAAIARSFDLGERTTFRPFFELQAGVEDYARIGADLMIMRAGFADLLLREHTTGQLFSGVETDGTGHSFIVGGDITKVFDSAYLPASRGYQLTDYRTRLRAGIDWKGEKVGLFYGVTYLGEEFKAQPEGQLVGTVNVRFNF